MQRIGLISDTHGLLRPEALVLLNRCDRIIHAGDVGRPEVLDALAAIAPLTVVRGNNDKGAWADDLPDSAQLQVDGVLVHVLHDVSDLHNLPPPLGTRVVVSGHSHKPSIVEREGVLLVNPGSAGPRRFKLPVCIAELVVHGARVSAQIVELPVAGMIPGLHQHANAN